MVAAERWAAAFIGAAGDNAAGAFAVLKTLLPPLGQVHGVISGFAASKQLEGILRRAADQVRGSGQGAVERELETALRFLVLVVRKGCFGRVRQFCEAIEAALNRKKGVITALVESARPLDGDYQSMIKERIRARAGAPEVKLQFRIVPELLEGCRIRIGSERLDASLRSQLIKLAAALGAGAAHRGGFDGVSQALR
jgi:F-type H+-transporting ATPase subunit delta